MKTYIKKPKSVKISNIKEKKFSLSGFSYREVFYSNKNISLLKDLLKENKKGFEPGSDKYINFSENYFIRISEMDDLNFTFNITESTNRITPVSNKNFIKKGDIVFQTASNVGNVNFYNGPKAYYNSHIRKLDFDNKYYLFAILKSNFCKNQVDVGGSIKGVDNFSNEKLENIKIPFPTTNNYGEPEKIEKLISLITQNIVDKEEQIKRKNKIIDKKIEKELQENQKGEELKYRFPKISEIKEVGRLDTGLYEKKFKKIYNNIQNYLNGVSKINDLGFKTKKGPNLAISVIGKSYYSNKKINSKFKQLILSKNVTEEGGIKNLQYIGSKVNLPTLNQYDFMLFARGDIGRVLLIDDFLVGATSNFDVFFISSDLPYYKNIFLLNYFKYLKSIKFWEYFGVGGSGAPSLTDYFLKKLDIPNFPDLFQKEIAKEYYNKINKNNNLNFDNYLEKEKARNEKLGIFQLNMELFSLREVLEDLIDKIVMDEKIDISFDY